MQTSQKSNPSSLLATALTFNVRLSVCGVLLSPLLNEKYTNLLQDTVVILKEGNVVKHLKECPGATNVQ